METREIEKGHFKQLFRTKEEVLVIQQNESTLTSHALIAKSYTFDVSRFELNHREGNWWRD